MLPKLNKDMVNEEKDKIEQNDKLTSSYYENDYAKVEMMKLKPKIDSGNTENLRRKFGFDNKKMLPKRSDIQINTSKSKYVKEYQYETSTFDSNQKMEQQSEKKVSFGKKEERKKLG